MRCLRCGGFMAWEWYLDPVEAVDVGLSRGWRCMNCGGVIDAVFLSHRIASRGGQRVGDRAAEEAGAGTA